MVTDHEQRQLDQGRLPDGWALPPVQGYGMTKDRREYLMENPNAVECHKGHPSFPVHEYQYLMEFMGESIVECTLCGYKAVDREEKGIYEIEDTLDEGALQHILQIVAEIS